uniref:CFEM domain-containing protein n=1 Tax=Ganoderma boninense TaxID=34458 RepID=A0A5K1JUP2_9APHY|nr:CFEM domain-containing protein [Ganoderma boninense]
MLVDAKALGPESCTPKRPARPTATSRTNSLRRLETPDVCSRALTLSLVAPHSPPPESEYGCDSPSSATPSAVHSRSASCASAISDATTTTTTTSKQRPGSPLSILKRLGFRESSRNRHPSAGARKKKNAAAHRRAGSDGEPPVAAAANGTVEH